MLDKLTRDDFAGAVGAAFKIQDRPEGAIDLALVEARNLSVATTAPGRRPPFSLLFRGPRSPVLPQSIYPLVHPSFGRLEIFLVPVGEDADGVTYEAIFN
jgi:hypothetical protein